MGLGSPVGRPPLGPEIGPSSGVGDVRVCSVPRATTRRISRRRSCQVVGVCARRGMRLLGSGLGSRAGMGAPTGQTRLRATASALQQNQIQQRALQERCDAQAPLRPGVERASGSSPITAQSPTPCSHRVVSRRSQSGRQISARASRISTGRRELCSP